jgi:voltage-gated potassium channel
MPAGWDALMVVLTILSIAVVVVEEVVELRPDVTHALHVADTVVCGVFLTEFVMRLRRAQRRWEFLRRNWLDLLGSVPLVGPLRSLRVLRVVRILRVTRVAAAWRRIALRHEIPLPGRTLGNIGILMAVVWVASATAFFHYEHGANESVQSFVDALWWSMTTLSTVGYGDLFPKTPGGRAVAVGTMIFGIGLLGTVAAAVASAFVDFRDRGRRGLRSYAMRDHFLVLGWNDKAQRAIVNFRSDPRYQATDIVVVADLPEAPCDLPGVRFVRGLPERTAVLERASAAEAGAAIVLARDPADARSDHESVLVVTSLRRLNPAARIAVELVDPGNDEFLRHAGCDAVIDMTTTAANLLVRSVQDIGVSDVVCELLSSGKGSELYRVEIDGAYVGKSYREYVLDMLERGWSVVGVVRAQAQLMAPSASVTLADGDVAFVVAPEPPS